MGRPLFVPSNGGSNSDFAATPYWRQRPSGIFRTTVVLSMERIAMGDVKVDQVLISDE
jgi:hypothetical protein